MLILSRRRGEKVMIGDDIEFTILDDTAYRAGHRDRQYKIGITAPSHIKIHREEVYRKIKEQEEENYGNR